jgi:transcriptional regulator with XRE-family HTH domain
MLTQSKLAQVYLRLHTDPMTTSLSPAGGPIPEWTLADRFRKARLTSHLSQKAFAAQLDINASAYSQWEAGNSKPRDVVAVARRIELLTGIPASWTLGLDDAKSPHPDGPGRGSEGLLPHLDSNQKPFGNLAPMRAKRVSWSQPRPQAA